MKPKDTSTQVIAKADPHPPRTQDSEGKHPPGGTAQSAECTHDPGIDLAELEARCPRRPGETIERWRQRHERRLRDLADGTIAPRDPEPPQRWQSSLGRLPGEDGPADRGKPGEWERYFDATGVVRWRRRP